MIEIYKGKTTEDYLEFYREKPQEILIETVSACNLRCIGCPQALESYRETKWKPTFMDFDLYVSILKQTKELWPPLNCGLYHTGEITLMPTEMFDRYTGAAKRILTDSDSWDSIGFYTNGLLMGPEKRKIIIGNGINWVRLSFDGGTRESYEKVRVGSSFDTVYYNAIALAEEVEASGRNIRLEVIFVPYTENEDTIEAFNRLWRFTGWRAQTGGAMNYAGMMTEAVEPRRHKAQFEARRRHSVPCPRVFEQFSVLVDGRVSLCSADPAGNCILGDLREQTIGEIWNGLPRKMALRHHLDSEGKRGAGMVPCDACDYTQFCAVPKGEWFGEVEDEYEECLFSFIFAILFAWHFIPPARPEVALISRNLFISNILFLSFNILLQHIAPVFWSIVAMPLLTSLLTICLIRLLEVCSSKTNDCSSIFEPFGKSNIPLSGDSCIRKIISNQAPFSSRVNDCTPGSFFQSPI